MCMHVCVEGGEGFREDQKSQGDASTGVSLDKVGGSEDGGIC